MSKSDWWYVTVWSWDDEREGFSPNTHKYQDESTARKEYKESELGKDITSVLLIYESDGITSVVEKKVLPNLNDC